MKLNRVGYYALAVSSLMASCKDDVRDEQMPSVSITSPAADTKVWLDVPVRVDVVDNQGVSKVAFYLDDELLGEDTDAPYELSFDSKEYEDGTYTLRTVAFDGQSNREEATQQIEIFNKLLQLNVEGEYVGESRYIREAWVIAANTEGDVIEAVMLENDKSFTVDRPEGMYDDKIRVALYFQYYFGESQYIYVDEYQDVSPKVLTFTGYSGETNEVEALGSATLSLTIPETYRADVYGENITWQSSSVYNGDGTTNHNYMLDVYDHPASAYVQMYDGESSTTPLYSNLEDIQVGAVYNLEENNFTPMSLWQSISIPADYSASISVRGNLSNGNRYDLTYSSKPEGTTTLNAFTPGDAFDSYSYYLQMRDDRVSYSQSAESPPSSSYDIPSVGLQVTANDNNLFSATVNYEASYSYSSWDYYYYDNTNYTSSGIHWIVYGNINNGSVQNQRISLPAALVERTPLLQDHLSDLAYYSTVFMKRDEISSVADYFKTVYRPSGEYIGFRNYESVTVYPSTENARTAQERTVRHPDALPFIPGRENDLRFYGERK